MLNPPPDVPAWLVVASTMALFAVLLVALVYLVCNWPPKS